MIYQYAAVVFVPVFALLWWHDARAHREKSLCKIA